MKKGLGIALAVFLAFVFAGCNMVSVNPEKDNAQIVAVVEGTEVPKSDYYDVINTYISQYGISVDDLTSGDNAEELRTGALDQVVNQELLWQQAVADGLVDESDEHREEVRKEIQETLDSTLESYKSSYEDESEAQAAYDTYVENNGYSDMEAAIDKKILDDALNSVYEKATEDVTVSDEEAEEYFNEQVEVQKAAIDEDPSSYSLYTSQDGNFYNPQGSDYVKHILISLPDDVQSEISSLRSSGDDEGADKLRDEELAKIKADADAALARAEAGEDFDALIEELGSDPGMEQEPAKTEGYMVYEGSNYVDAFEEASLALTTDGEISELVPTDFGYHIIKRIKDASGPVTFESVKDSVIEKQVSDKKSTVYQEYLEELKNSKNITRYEDRLDVYNL